MQTLSEIARTLVDGLIAQLPKGGFRLESIEIAVGMQVDLEPEALRVEVAALLPEVQVEMRRVDALMRCQDCGAEFPPDEYPCPVCGSGHVELVHGLELEVVKAKGTRI
jgi:Zn finger protein HypA/HybF involved in hydrogenase expression